MAFISEIRCFAFSRVVPYGWLSCDGQVLAKALYPDLAELLGDTFRQQGQSYDPALYFALPDLRGRTPVHDLGGQRGMSYGQEQVALPLMSMPAHAHVLQGSSAGANSDDPNGRLLGSQGRGASFQTYASTQAGVAFLAGTSLSSTGGGQPHDNMPPYQTVNYLIAWRGARPDRISPDPTVGPFIGEMRLLAFEYAPAGWAACDGRILPIGGYSALFATFGAAYGGDGRSTFGLPDLRGRVALCQGQSSFGTMRNLGERAGQERVLLSEAELPPHSHRVQVSAGPASSGQAQGGWLATPRSNFYGRQLPSVKLAAAAVTVSPGPTQGHENMPPFLTLNYSLCLAGYYPSPNAEEPASPQDARLDQDEDAYFVGEIRCFASAQLPTDFLPCDGSQLLVQDYTHLYALIGTTYGGVPTVSFGLPDLRGRHALGQYQGPGLSARTLGTQGGVSTVSLQPQELPSHSHACMASSSCNTSSPSEAYLGAAAGVAAYVPGNSAPVAMAAGAIGNAGANNPHENCSPALVLNYGIAVFGLYPQRPPQE